MTCQTYQAPSHTPLVMAGPYEESHNHKNEPTDQEKYCAYFVHCLAACLAGASSRPFAGARCASGQDTDRGKDECVVGQLEFRGSNVRDIEV